ncbi:MULTISPECIES: branched-chain amino acid ABC transporter permease [Streptomyces]|uniref:branched-chain amino acid ABC transporter permease n=1 Tax=Streptomyces TaxID=1883 RepID=UPI0019042C53|nr:MULTISPECIES: branched-chain amino acid ABC transporter permease [unclassified Streptomyces]MCU4744975.1 branched-chain amino acid ABC transporter permease [Streptomyces sp. G-5]QQN80046.1 branched-chain amino acid ABC transporter permease [Streptomyces sp. XC 2026]
MSTVKETKGRGSGRERMPSAAKLRQVRWYQEPRWKRLGALLVLAVVGAQVTGVQGTSTDLFYALGENFTGSGIWIWLALCVGVWLIREFLSAPVNGAWTSLRDQVSPPVARVRGVWQGDPRLRYGGGGVLLIVLIALPLWVSTYWQQVMVDQIAIFVLLAIGLNVVIGWAGMLDLGFVAFFAIGAYSAAYWTGSLPVEPPMVLNTFLVIPIAIVTCLLAGVLLGAPTLRLRGDYLAIVTLGFHEIVYLAARNWTDFTGGSRGARMSERFVIDLGFWRFEWGLDPKPYYWLLLGFIVVIIFLFLRLEHSRVGRAWTAIREDEVAAAATGVNTVRMKLLAFGIGASTSGVAGVVYASKVAYISPENFVLLMSILVLAYVIFGGMGSVPGVLAGAALLVWLPEFLRDSVDPQDRFMYLGALLVIMMIYRPQGLLPSKRRQRELQLAEVKA